MRGHFLRGNFFPGFSWSLRDQHTDGTSLGRGVYSSQGNYAIPLGTANLGRFTQYHFSNILDYLNRSFQILRGDKCLVFSDSENRYYFPMAEIFLALWALQCKFQTLSFSKGDSEMVRLPTPESGWRSNLYVPYPALLDQDKWTEMSQTLLSLSNRHTYTHTHTHTHTYTLTQALTLLAPF